MADENFDVETDDDKIAENANAAKAEKAAAEDISFEVEDDTPAQDRGRKAAPPPDEVSDDELASYDEKVQTRIKKFTRGYHDERRAKEAALRERKAAEDFARQVYEENKQLQEKLAAGSQQYIDQSKSVAETELAQAKRKYRDAYDSGDADELVAAQEDIAKATLKIDKISGMRPLQVKETQVQRQHTPVVDEKAENWKAKNDWFGSNRKMSAFALALHEELVTEKGIEPTSDRYYQEIDEAMRETFPSYFGSHEGAASKNAPEPADEDTSTRRATKPAAVVAPATRSTSPTKIKLTQSEVNVARQLNIPLELYAKQVAKLRNGA